MAQLQSFINTLKEHKDFTFNDIKTELEKKKLVVKHDDDLFLVAYLEYDNEGNENKLTELEKNSRCLVFEKKGCSLLCGNLFGKISYNDDAEKYIREHESNDAKFWNKVQVQETKEGTLMMLFYYNNKLRIATRRCLDANESYWNTELSHYDMFMEAAKNRIDFKSLDKNLCYFVVLVHPKNIGIIDSKKVELIHIDTCELRTLRTVNAEIKANPPISKPRTFDYSDVKTIKAKLNEIDETQRKTKKITEEGFIIKVYNDEKKSGQYTALKLQTKLYQELKKIKPNYGNPYQIYLHLYQHDHMHDYLQYVMSELDKANLISLISKSFKTLTSEILEIYRMTRNNNYMEMYNNLGPTTKTVLYNIHGIYLERRTEEVKRNVTMSRAKILLSDVFKFLKKMDVRLVSALFRERMLAIIYHVPYYPNQYDYPAITTLTKLLYPVESQSYRFGTPQVKPKQRKVVIEDDDCEEYEHKVPSEVKLSDFIFDV